MDNILTKISGIYFWFLLIQSAFNCAFGSPVTSNVLVSEWREYKKYQAGLACDTHCFVAYQKYVRDIYLNHDRKTIAFPSNVTNDQICAVVGKWLDEHPEEWNKPDNELISNALIQAFPKQTMIFGVIDISEKGILRFVDTSVSLIFNAILGVITSIIGWFILFRMLVPKFKFSNKINKILYSSGENPVYRIKFKNVGQRNAIDIEVFVRLRVRNLSQTPRFKLTWTIITLHTNTNHIPHLSKNNNRILILHLKETQELHVLKFKNALQGKEINLENLLSLGDKAELVVWALAYDEFSGARKAFVSKHYKISDIMEGKFSGDDKLDVIHQSMEKIRMPLMKLPAVSSRVSVFRRIQHSFTASVGEYNPERFNEK